jgi:hypothetical protein
VLAAAALVGVHARCCTPTSSAVRHVSSLLREDAGAAGCGAVVSFSWGVAEWARGRVKETNNDVSQARLFRIKAGQGVAHCNPAAANMEQSGILPRKLG